MALVFFDIDKTLIKSTTPVYMVKYYYANGAFGPVMIFWTALYTVLYAMDWVEYRSMLNKALEPFVGRRKSVVRGEFVEIFNKLIKPNIYKDAADAVNKHISQGDTVVLLSSTSIDIADPIADYFGVEVIATTPILKDGRYVLDFEEPIPIAEGKVTAAENYCNENGFNLSEAWFYSDSHSDLPLLSAVGFPQVVNPDFRLKKKAIKNNWRILEYTEVMGS